MEHRRRTRSRQILLFVLSVVFVGAVEASRMADLPLMPAAPILAAAGAVLLCFQLKEVVRSVKEKKDRGGGAAAADAGSDQA